MSAKDFTMIASQIDPSLHNAPPAPPQIDDGFAPPAARGEPGPAPQDAQAQSPPMAETAEALGPKSLF